MADTRNVDALTAALIELTACLNSPRQDEALLAAAGVALDRALFPLLVRLNAAETLSIAQLAEQAGRDASTVSRQVAKLEQLGFVRRVDTEDMRMRAASITPAGASAATAITRARRRFLGELMQDWSEDEKEALPRLVHRLAAAMRERLLQG